MKTKKKVYTDESTFTFYKNNLKAGKFELTLKEIKEKYLAFLATKENDWILYYGHQTVIAFITDKEGLSSSGEDALKDGSLETILMEVRHTLPCYKKTLKVF